MGRTGRSPLAPNQDFVEAEDAEEIELRNALSVLGQWDREGARDEE